MTDLTLLVNSLAVPLTVAVVAGLNKAFTLSKGAKMACATGVAAICAVAAQIGGYGPGWDRVPLVWIIATLSAMGLWSGLKNGNEVVKGAK